MKLQVPVNPKLFHVTSPFRVTVTNLRSGIISPIWGGSSTFRGNDDITKAKELLDLINEVVTDGQRVDNKSETRVLSTNAVTKQLGLTARTVRFYSEVGIATPMRRGSTRLFTPAQVRRLHLARDLRGIGMDVKSVADLLDELYKPQPKQEKMQALTQLFSGHLKELLRREEEVRQQYFVTNRLVEELFATCKPA